MRLKVDYRLLALPSAPKWRGRGVPASRVLDPRAWKSAKGIKSDYEGYGRKALLGAKDEIENVKRFVTKQQLNTMHQLVSNGCDVPQREFVYKLWNKAFDVEGKEEWAIGKHEILKKTASIIYAHVVPYLGEEYDWGRAKSLFEISRKELRHQGSTWVMLMRTTFYISEAAARAAIPKRVQLEPAQLTYFGFSGRVTLQELELAYCELALSLDPAMGGSAEAVTQLLDHYQAALRSFQK